MKNWAGNFQYGAKEILAPRSLDELQSMVEGNARIRAIGSRHSFNNLADSQEVLLTTEKLRKVIEIESSKSEVTVEGGIRYGDLAPIIDAAGFGLPNLASLPHISIAGAIATATHGSGFKNQQLGSAVNEIEFVLPDGSLRTVSKELHPHEFYGSVVHLGSLGIISKLKLNLIPRFNISQRVYLDLPFGVAFDHFEEIMSSAYSVSLFTDWKDSRFTQVWKKELTVQDTSQPTDSVYSAGQAQLKVHPILGNSADKCTDQLGVPGPWYERLSHFKLEFTPSNGDELQSEYWIPVHDAVDALKSLMDLQTAIAPLLYISEIRAICKDSFWLSPAYEQDCIAIHFTWRQVWSEVRTLLPKIEERLAPFQARPHWGKLFTMPLAKVAQLYPRINEFRRLAEGLDPMGKFSNPYMDELLARNYS